MKKKIIRKYEKIPVVEVENKAPSKPLVSVLVLAYQHENYIEKCVSAIVNQKTNFPFEVLIGEDNSSDQTRSLCMELASKYNDKIRLFLHSRENNIRVKDKPTWHFNSIYIHSKAKGKYIALCEGDDYWTDESKLQKQINFLERNEGFSACAHLADITFEGTLEKSSDRFKRNIDKTVFSTTDILEYTPFHTASIVYRKKLLVTDEVSEEQFLALNRDHPTMIILSTKGPIKRLPEIMSVYRKNPGGFSENTDYLKEFKGNMETIEALETGLPGFKSNAIRMKSHWHRFLIDKRGIKMKKRMSHYILFVWYSFYDFPYNLRKIASSSRRIFVLK